MKFETTIKQIIPRALDITSFRFSRPNQFNYKPGQYLFITIKQGSKELTKPFSFSSSPTEKDHIEFTKKLTDHEYSIALKNSKVGDWARIDAPYGELTFEGEYPKIALLAGGIGITPFVSICKNATEKHLNSQITLFYGCSTEEELVFKQEFEAMQIQNKKLKVIFTLSQPSPQWRGLTGRINVELIKQILPDYKEHMFFACGPPPMVKAMEILLESLGLPRNKLKIESLIGH